MGVETQREIFSPPSDHLFDCSGSRLSERNWIQVNRSNPLDCVQELPRRGRTPPPPPPPPEAVFP